MDALYSALSLLVTLGILVTFHEYGHYIVAKYYGVKVLRFSVGFGKPLYTWHNREGTEFCVAAIPLGGYVKMLDEREQDVPDHEKPYAFNNKPPMQRVAIAAAGPIANFIFAVFAYWLMFVVGFSAIKPVVGEVTPGSIADQAGLSGGYEFLSVDGRTTPGWREVSIALANHIGESGSFDVEARKVDLSSFATDSELKRNERTTPDQTAVPHEATLAERFSFVLDEKWVENDPENLMEDLGIVRYRPHVPAILGTILEDGPGGIAGLQSGDKVLAVDGESVEDWFALVANIQSKPEQDVLLEIEREGQGFLQVRLKPALHELESGKQVGRIGVGVQPFSYPESMIKTVRLGPGEALISAGEQMVADTTMTLNAIRKMVVGLLSLENLSGPITIAQVASQSISSGFEHFLGLLALLSVSLGVLNLLPIPVLDGGHILFYTAEALRGKPLPESIQVLGLKIGLGLVLALMVIAFYNDIMRL